MHENLAARGFKPRFSARALHPNYRRRPSNNARAAHGPDLDVAAAGPDFGSGLECRPP